MKSTFIILFILIGLFALALYLWDITWYKRELKRRNLHFKRMNYETFIPSSSTKK